MQLRDVAPDGRQRNINKIEDVPDRRERAVLQGVPDDLVPVQLALFGFHEQMMPYGGKMCENKD